MNDEINNDILKHLKCFKESIPNEISEAHKLYMDLVHKGCNLKSDYIVIYNDKGQTWSIMGTWSNYPYVLSVNDLIDEFRKAKETNENVGYFLWKNGQDLEEMIKDGIKEHGWFV